MITGKQRAFLRGLANKVDATVQVGKGGVNENLVSLVSDTLEKHELVKVHVLENCMTDVREVCHELSALTKAEEVQVIGSKFVLYRESEENKKIDLKNLTLRVEKKPKKEVKPLYKAKEAARKEKKRKEEKRLKTKKFFSSRRGRSV